MSHTDVHERSKVSGTMGMRDSGPDEEDWPEPDLSELSLAGSMSGTFGARASRPETAPAEAPAPPAPAAPVSVPQQDIPGMRCVTGSFPLDSVLREADSIPLTATGSFAVAGLPRVDLMSLGPETAAPRPPLYDPFLPPPMPPGAARGPAAPAAAPAAPAAAPAAPAAAPLMGSVPASSGFLPGPAPCPDPFGSGPVGNVPAVGQASDPFSVQPLPEALMAALDSIPTTDTGSFALPGLPRVDLMTFSAPPPPPRPAPAAPQDPASHAFAQAFAPATSGFTQAMQAFVGAQPVQVLPPAPVALQAPAGTGRPAAMSRATPPAPAANAPGAASHSAGAAVGPGEARHALSKTDLQNLARQALERQKEGKKPVSAPVAAAAVAVAAPTSHWRGVMIGVFLGSLTLAALIFMGRV